MFRITYEKTLEGRFEVTLFQLAQTISVSSSHFYHVANVTTDVIFGCKDISISIVLELGFVFPALEKKFVI